MMFTQLTEFFKTFPLGYLFGQAPLNIFGPPDRPRVNGNRGNPLIRASARLIRCSWEMPKMFKTSRQSGGPKMLSGDRTKDPDGKHLKKLCELYKNYVRSPKERGE